MPNPGVLSVTVTPPAISVDALTVSSAKVPLLGFSVLGNAGQPDARSMLDEVDLAPGMMADYSFSMLPQGLYSAVGFTLGGSTFDGAWRGMPLHVHLEHDDHGTAIEVRSQSGAEIAPGQNGGFTFAVDTNSWFAGNLLDGATVAGGEINVGDNSNDVVAEQLAHRIAASFSLQ